MEINMAEVGRPQLKPFRPTVGSPEEQLASAKQLEKAYTDFIGKTFFGQMMKAMRSTVDKPAYFHGGQGEEVFSAQLDQQLADTMSEASAPQISQPMFERQFPRQAALIADAEKASKNSMTDLTALRRR